MRDKRDNSPESGADCIISFWHSRNFGCEESPTNDLFFFGKGNDHQIDIWIKHGYLQNNGL